MLEGDIGGGLVLQRLVSIPKDDPKVIHISSSIIARTVGAGSGGFSRFAPKKKKISVIFSLLTPAGIIC